MAHPIIRFKNSYRKKFQPKVISLGGVRVSSDLKDITSDVRALLYKEVYEDAERRFAREIIKPQDRVLELGTGIGLVSLTCAHICSPQNVHSFEANPALEGLIKKNYALNKMTPNLTMKGVSQTPGEETFYVGASLLSSSLYNRENSRPVTVQFVAFDDLVKTINPTVLIMDIEGAEVDLLTQNDLANIEKIVVEVHPQIVKQQQIDNMLNHLKSSGFSPYKNASNCHVMIR